MTSRKGKTSAVRKSSPSLDGLMRAAWQPRFGLLAATMACLVARVLIPSESAIEDAAGVFFALALLGITAFAALLGAREKDAAWRWTPLDATVLAFTGWFVVSSIVAARFGAPRPAINAVWLWISFAATLLLMRRLVRTDGERRAVVAVMASLACALAMLGIEQFAIELPQVRREYYADPAKALADLNMPTDRTSREVKLFEQRLESSEPFATFGLTNSLAGFLAPWLIVSCAAAWGAARQPGAPKSAWLGPLLPCVPIAACLLLTKSRSAYLAVAAGAAAWLVLQPALVKRFNAKWIAGGVVGIALAVALGVSAGALDREIITEAGKSLGYRGQYWRAAAEMVGDHPVVGVGPGQFQQDYTRYKALTASEVVADPHNFLMEIVATAGIPALLLLGAVAWAAWKEARASTAPVAETHEPPFAAMWMIAGALCGFPLAFPVSLMAYASPSPNAYRIGLPSMLIALALWHVWGRGGSLTRLTAALGVFVLLVNLLAAGGISIPGVANTLWVLLALIAPVQALPSMTTSTERSTWFPMTVASVACALVAGCYFTAYRPLIVSMGELQSARSYPQYAEEHLRAATEADPWSADNWRALAAWRFGRWQNAPTEQHWKAVDEALQESLRLSPASAVSWQQAGKWRYVAAERMKDPALAKSSVSAFQQAAMLYPNLAEIHGDLAFALDRAHEPEQARIEADKALNLDQITPHEDLKLGDARREELTVLRDSLTPR